MRVNRNVTALTHLGYLFGRRYHIINHIILVLALYSRSVTRRNRAEMSSGGENQACPWETLISFCKNGKEQEVGKMLKEANESELSELSKATCLYNTIIGGNSALFKCFLSRWCPVRQVIAGQQEARNASEESDLFITRCLYATVNGGKSALFKCFLSRWCPVRQDNAGQQEAQYALELSDLFKATCLNATVIGGNSELLQYLLSKCPSLHEDIANRQDDYGNTVLHMAVRRNRMDLVKQLIKFQPKLGRKKNMENETPLFVAIRLGIGEMVKALVDKDPESVLELCGNKDVLHGKKNVLHLAVELHLVHIVLFLTRFLSKRKDTKLTQIINHRAGKPLSGLDIPPDADILPRVSTLQLRSNFVLPGNDDSRHENKKRNSRHRKKTGDATILGDTPLHIAARRKCLQMVDYLLGVPGVDKYAMNDKGFTALDIAKEKIEYYERFHIIAKLSDYPGGHRPFMYSAPSPSPEKLAKANKIVGEDYHNRQNAELVVAALLAAMTFSAVFQVPGGFQTENKHGIVIGAPTLINSTSFKLFLISDCVAFFISLFVVFLWQISLELATGDKMLFMCINSLLVCLSFAFTASGFIAALYVVLAHKVKSFAEVVIGIMGSIIVVGCIASAYKAATFSVTRARFNRLCGVPCWLDDAVELTWLILEKCCLLDVVRKCKEWVVENLIWGLCGYGCRHTVKDCISEPCGNGRPKSEAPKTVTEDGLSSPSPFLKGSQYSV